MPHKTYFLVTGSRDLPEELTPRVYEILDQLEGDLVMINGCARGLDSMCLEWAEQNNVEVEKYPAEWEKYGRSAGPIRNKQMVDRLLEMDGTTVLAFVRGELMYSRGTKNCVSTAVRAGLTPNVFEF